MVVNGGGRVVMIDQFTEGARQTVVLAQEEARRLNHPYIGEHEDVAAQVLVALGTDIELARQQVIDSLP